MNEILRLFFLRRGPSAARYSEYVQHERQKTRNVNEQKLNKVLEHKCNVNANVQVKYMWQDNYRYN